MLFQHTHQPEGRCDPLRQRPDVLRCQVSTHAPARRPVRLARHAKLAAKELVSTHAPARRPVRHFSRRVSRRHYRGFNTRTSPKAGATRRPCSSRLSTVCFNTRTSPKAGATRTSSRTVGALRVSTHAPARRPVRPCCGVTPSARSQFQHTHQPEGRCDQGLEQVGRRVIVSTHAPARRPVRRVSRHPLRGAGEFQHTHQPEGRCDRSSRARCGSCASFNTRTSPKAGATMLHASPTRRQ